jgi:lipoate-protein ligase A
VPSPVTNLRSYSYTIDHQQFCEEVIEEFLYTHNDNIPVEPTIFSKDDISNLPEEVIKSKEELTSWDWIYGQTPEFTHDFEMDMSWGTVVSYNLLYTTVGIGVSNGTYDRLPSFDHGMVVLLRLVSHRLFQRLRR